MELQVRFMHVTDFNRLILDLWDYNEKRMQCILRYMILSNNAEYLETVLCFLDIM